MVQLNFKLQQFLAEILIRKKVQSKRTTQNKFAHFQNL